MTDLEFAITVAVIAAALAVGTLATWASEKVRVPAPAFFLVAAAVAALLLPQPTHSTLVVDSRVVSVALAVILFDGGANIGWRRLRSSVGPIVTLGLAGTALTAVIIAAGAHFLFGFPIPASLLLGAALSPTDPAVVFSVLGRREISGRSGTILEGESGANDPVGIAIMVSLLAATGSGWTTVGSGLEEFGLQMGIGAAVGIAGGFALRFVLPRLPFGNDALASVFTLAAGVLLYGVGTLAHGSGFLAAFIAGIVIGDVRSQYRTEIRRFSAGMTSLAEIVAFVVLGLTVRLGVVVQPAVLIVALGVAAIVILIARPIGVGVLLLGVRASAGEKAFVLWAGLKGAVPILLGLLVVNAGAPHAAELYAVVFVVVLVSVVVQGSTVPIAARLLKVPMTAKHDVYTGPPDVTQR